MLDRPAPRNVSSSDADLTARPAWPRAFVACAGLLGAAGVAVGAAGAHVGGGDLTRLSSEFLLIHAAVLVGGSAVALSLGRTSKLFVMALGLVAVGSVLFGGELALAGLLDWRPIPLAAPTGGLCLIAGWLLLGVAAASSSRRR